MAGIKRIVRTVFDLIKIESVKAKPGKLCEAINYVKRFFEGEELETRKFLFDGKPSLIITPKKTNNAGLFFLAHLDVVEAEQNQFKPFIKNGMLYGRGSADMKGNAAIALHVFKELHKSHSIGLIITTDEEIGGFKGAGKLVGKIKPRFVIATEPSNNGVIFKEKGVLWLKIKAKGRACHGSRPWLGINAIERLMNDLQKMKALFEETTEKNRWKPTMNIGMISGGKAANIVPDAAEATIDIRYTEEFNVNAFMKKLGALNISFEVIELSPMMENKKDNEFIKELQRIYSRHSRKKAGLLKEHGASDARFFSERRIPCAILGLPGQNYHGLNEFIQLKDIPVVYNTYKEFAEMF